MKKIAYLIMAACALFCTSCEDVEEPENEHVIEKYQNNRKDAQVFNISLLEDEVEKDRYHLFFYTSIPERSFSVSSLLNSWKITNVPSWMTVTPTEGTPNVKSIDVKCVSEENLTDQPRFGTMYMEVGGKRLTIDIIQESSTFNALKPFDGVSLSLVTYMYGYRYGFSFKRWGGTNTFGLTSQYDWSFTSIPQWVTIEPTSGVGSQELVLITLEAPYNEGWTRTGVAKLKVGDHIFEILLEQFGEITY